MIYGNPKVRKHDTAVLTIESLNIVDKKITYAHALDIKQESLPMPERRSFKFFATASFCIFNAIWQAIDCDLWPFLWPSVLPKHLNSKMSTSHCSCRTKYALVKQ